MYVHISICTYMTPRTPQTRAHAYPSRAFDPKKPRSDDVGYRPINLINHEDSSKGRRSKAITIQERVNVNHRDVCICVYIYIRQPLRAPGCEESFLSLLLSVVWFWS